MVLSRALPPARGARSMAIGAALLLHALLAWWVGQALRQAPPAAVPEQRALWMRLLPAPMPPTAPARSAQTPRAATPARLRDAPAPASAITSPVMADSAATAPPPAAAQTASAADAPLLLDSEATRRALREAARGPLLSERAAAATDAPALRTEQEQLGEEVAKAAKGDCLKGEFVGGGMGLLSLPFLAAAALTDKCRR